MPNIYAEYPASLSCVGRGPSNLVARCPWRQDTPQVQIGGGPRLRGACGSRD